jgi:two-component system cell cycle response regulator DivK
MPKILYVEDNPQNMRLVYIILTNAGYEVIEAKNGLSGIATAVSESPDLILMDMNLPDIKGLEVVTRLKASPALSSIPVIALTADSMSDDRDRCLSAGCDGYLAKPVMQRELLNTIEEFIK